MRIPLLSLIIAILLSLTLAGCGGSYDVSHRHNGQEIVRAHGSQNPWYTSDELETNNYPAYGACMNEMYGLDPYEADQRCKDRIRLREYRQNSIPTGGYPGSYGNGYGYCPYGFACY